MSTDTELLATHLRSARRIIDLAPTLAARLTTIADHANDGYPTSTPGAPIVATGGRALSSEHCTADVERFGLVSGIGGHDGPHGALVARKVPCGKLRPCIDHDGGGKTTTTEAAALNQNVHDRTRTVIDQQIHVVDRALDIIERATAGTSGERVGQNHARCACNDGREGSTAWGDKLCRRIPDERCAGLALECFTRMNDWRIIDGQEPIARQSEQMCKRCGIRPATVGRTDGLCSADRMADSRARKLVNA